jgi:CRP-like cAMP-binding protein
MDTEAVLRGQVQTDFARIAAFLAVDPLMCRLRPTELDHLAACGTESTLDPETPIAYAGDPIATFYVLVSGSVALSFEVNGSPAVVTTLGPHDLFGWSWTTDRSHWRYNATTVLPSRVIAFDAAEVLHLCEREPHLGYVLMRRVAAVIADRLEAEHRLLIQRHYG